MAQKPAAGSFEQLQEALFGPGAASSGGLPPGTDREEVRAPRKCVNRFQTLMRTPSPQLPSLFTVAFRAIFLSRRQFHADARKLQRRLKRMRAGLIDPNSKAMIRWDALLIFAMLYTTFITPTELAFVRTPSADALFVCNQIINLVFWIDLFMQFCIPIKNKKDGRTIRSHQRIAWVYATSWFPVDLLSVLPIDVFDVAGVFTRNATSRSNRQFVRIMRLLRLFKLLKLLRILRVSRVFSRLETRFALTYTTNEAVKYLLVISIALHWFACAYAMLALFSLSEPRTPELLEAVAQRRSEVGSDVCSGCSIDDAWNSPQCEQDCLTSCEIELLAGLNGVSQSLIANREHWMCRAKASGQITQDWDQEGFEVYVFCFVVAVGQLSGGAISIAPMNISENILFIIALLIGSVIMAVVQGVICGIVTIGDPHYIEHRQNTDQLNFLMDDMGVDQDLKVRVREYYKCTLPLLRRQAYADILPLLSPNLMTDVVGRMAAWVVNSVEWLSACEPDFLRDVFRLMERESFAVKERIDAVKLNVLNVGVVARGGKFLVPGSDRGPTWGDILLTAPALRNMAAARALTYVEVTTLTREDLDKCMEDYPESAAEVRREAMRQALIKATELINTQVQRKRERERRKAMSADEQASMDRQNQMRDAMGGGVDENDADDPDEVLKMICGVGGMKYREMNDAVSSSTNSTQ